MELMRVAGLVPEDRLDRMIQAKIGAAMVRHMDLMDSKGNAYSFAGLLDPVIADDLLENLTSSLNKISGQGVLRRQRRRSRM